MNMESKIEPRKAQVFSGLQPGGVLVVEDQDRQSAALIETLRAAGIEPLWARDGHQAIRITAIERPSVIFLDGLLPGMHGFEVARFIRHIDSSYHPYIVMLTGIYKNVTYRNDAILRYGIDEYVIKPIAAAKVLEIFETVALAGDGVRVAS